MDWILGAKRHLFLQTEMQSTEKYSISYIYIQSQPMKTCINQCEKGLMAAVET